jgi:hypothetical protein
MKSGDDMLLSKTRFINFIRCNRYVALDEIRKEKDKAIVSFSDDDDLESLMQQENNDKMNVLLNDMIDENDEDLLEKHDPQMETMLKYYNEIEMISGRIINKKFSGNTIYALDTYQQKRFSYEKEGFSFYCFLDGYQEDDDTIRIFEVKATTSKKFLDLTFKYEDEKCQVFEYNQEGMLVLREDLGLPVNKHYYQKIDKLKNRLSKEGRYVYDIGYQRYVLENAIDTHKDIKYYLGVLNSQYVFDGKVDEKNHPIYGDDIITFIDVTSLTKKVLPIIGADVDIVVNRLDQMNANPVPLGKHCQRKDSRECVFFPVCFGHIPNKNSIFTYLQSHHGFKDDKDEKHELYDLINEGYVKMEDIPRSWLKRKDNEIQRDVIESHHPYIKEDKIKGAIKSLKYPIYHLDFETFPCPLPRFRGETPYTQSLFQFSIHIEDKPGVCDKDQDHYGFIAKTHDDQRKDLLESMLEVIKDDGGSIMVYNQSFEQTRLKELAKLYPEHKERLEDMILRLVDLMHFVKGNQKFYQALGFDPDEVKGITYYHEALNGSYSIKKVLPIFSNLKYDDLEIKNGTEALVTYANFPFMDEKTFHQKYNELHEYCKQDTWAMVEILESLRKLVL